MTTANSENNSTLSEASFSYDTSIGNDSDGTTQNPGLLSEQSTFLSQMNSTSSIEANSISNPKGELVFRPSVNSTPAVGTKKTGGQPFTALKNGKKKRHPCEICDKECNYPGYLAQHYCDSHFNDILKQEVARKFDEKKCKDCDKTINSSQDQTRHVGMKHGLINKLLEKKGLKSVAFKFYKYNNPAAKIAALKQAAAVVTSSMFVDETIPEETSEEASNISRYDEASSVMETETEDTATNQDQTSLMVRTDLCSISKQLESSEPEGSSFLTGDTTLVTESELGMNNMYDEGSSQAVDMDTTVTTEYNDSTDESMSPMILDTFSLKANEHDID